MNLDVNAFCSPCQEVSACWNADAPSMHLGNVSLPDAPYLSLMSAARFLASRDTSKSKDRENLSLALQLQGVLLKTISTEPEKTEGREPSLRRKDHGPPRPIAFSPCLCASVVGLLLNAYFPTNRTNPSR